MKLFTTRAEAITANADEAADAYRKAGKARAKGDVKAAKAWEAWGRECDQTANDFAAGRNDDVIHNP